MSSLRVLRHEHFGQIIGRPALSHLRERSIEDLAGQPLVFVHDAELHGTRRRYFAELNRVSEIVVRDAVDYLFDASA